MNTSKLKRQQYFAPDGMTYGSWDIVEFIKEKKNHYAKYVRCGVITDDEAHLAVAISYSKHADQGSFGKKAAIDARIALYVQNFENGMEVAI